MAISEIRSNQIALTTPYSDLPLYVHEDNIDSVRIDARKIEARVFRGKYVYGGNMDKKTCIWPGGDYTWTDESSGIDWVGVQGNDWICIVTKARDLDVRRVHNWLIFHTKGVVLCKFRESVIPEIEGIADPSSKLYEVLGQSIKKPFGIVSVQDGHEHGHEISIGEYEEEKYFKMYLEEYNRQALSGECEISDSDNDDDDEDSQIRRVIKRNVKEQPSVQELAGYDEKETIKYIQEEVKKDPNTTVNTPVQETNREGAITYLKERLKTGDDFSMNSTIQIAISAFQRLFREKLNADDIGVSIFNPKDFDLMDTEELDQSHIKCHLAERKRRQKKHRRNSKRRKDRRRERIQLAGSCDVNLEKTCWSSSVCSDGSCDVGIEDVLE